MGLGRSATKNNSFWLVAAFVFALFSSFAAAGDSGQTTTSANQLVREVVNNELHAAKTDHTHWMYRQHHVDPHMNVLRECIDSQEGVMCRLLEEGGRPLSKAEQAHEEQHLQDLAEHPEKVKAEQKARQRDGNRALKMLKALPDAFNYQYAGQDGKYLRLRFQPNPNFHPPDREGRVFHAMRGFVLVEPQTKRLAEISGQLIKNVDFGYGLLGHLDKGGTFEVKRQDVGDGVWQITLLNVKIQGKALFFKTINAQQEETTNAFKRMPDNLPVAKAASMLERPSLQAKAEQAH